MHILRLLQETELINL